MKRFFKTLFANVRNQGNGKIIIEDGVVLDLRKKAHLDISGKLILGTSDWKKDPRCSGLKILENGTLTVRNKEQIFKGCFISIGKGASLELDGGGFINHGCNIDCFSHIHIGRNTVIGKQVSIRDSDNHNMTYEGYRISAPIVIGKHCWIGMRACILKGVTIGDGAVIAAGAVVVHDVPSNTVVAGVPAVVVKSDIKWN